MTLRFGKPANRRAKAVKKSASRPKPVTVNTQRSGHGGISSWWRNLNWLNIRCSLIAFLILLVWIILWGRAAYLQLIRGEEYADRAKRQHYAAEVVHFPRGMITDRNGLILARSVQCRSVYADPRAIDDPEAAAKKLAPLLKQPVGRLLSKLSSKRQFVWLARHVDDATAADISAARIPGIVLDKEYNRVYPYRHVAGQLIGFTGLDGQGLEGLERAFDHQLAGSSGRQLIRRDARGRRFQITSASPLEEPTDLRLTIDLPIQSMVEEALAATVAKEKAKWGGVLVVDIPTGDILAWAQAPLFNPNNYKAASSRIYRNRLAQDALEPGSIFKPFLVAAAMREGLVNRNTPFYCEKGRWRTKYITIRDDTHAFGTMPVHRIIAMSSNIGSAKIGLLLGANRLHAFLDEMGFGKTVDLPIPQARGILRAPREWSEPDIMSTSFGQSVSVTPVQMAQAYLTLANQGVYKPLRLVDDNQKSLPAEGQRIFSASIARDVLSMLREVVDSGTGRNAAIKGISVGGKTGTAQKAGRHGRYGGERMASFVGLAPVEAPRTLIVVMIDEPSFSKYGGTVAAPLFRTALAQMLTYRGEMPSISEKAEQKKNDKSDRGRQTGKTKAPNNGRKPASGTSAGMPPADTALPAEPGTMPNVVGKNLRQAVEDLIRAGLVPSVKGEGGSVGRQEPAPGTKIDQTGSEAASCTLWLTERYND